MVLCFSILAKNLEALSISRRRRCCTLTDVLSDGDVLAGLLIVHMQLDVEHAFAAV